MEHTILEVNALSIQYKGNSDQKVVDSVSFSLKKGETLGLVGESGSGKTSIALALCNLLPEANTTGDAFFFSKKGKVSLFGTDKKENIRGRGIAMVLQDAQSSLNPAQTCGQQIIEALNFHFPTKKNEAKQAALLLLEKCQVDDPKRICASYPHQISGGQRQRVLICIGLACSPEILVLDEPTSALDASTKHEILEVLAHLQKNEGLSLLLISHDLDSIRELANQIVLLKNGQIIESNSNTQFFSNPKETYTRGYLAIQPNQNTRYKRLPELSQFELGVEQNLQVWTHTAFEARKTSLYRQKPILELSEASLSFDVGTSLFFSKKKKLCIFDQFNYALYPGEILGLVGSSGSGKTSFGRVLAGLQALDSGKIIYPENKKPKIQMVFQNPTASLNPKMRIDYMFSEAIETGGVFDKVKIKETTKSLLQLAKMPLDSLEKYPAAFSGGQQQRLSILRALASKPDILVCDEIVSALDVSIQASVLNLLLDIRDQLGLTCVFISHDAALVWQIADRVLEFPIR